MCGLSTTALPVVLPCSCTPPPSAPPCPPAPPAPAAHLMASWGLMQLCTITLSRSARTRVTSLLRTASTHCCAPPAPPPSQKATWADSRLPKQPSRPPTCARRQQRPVCDRQGAPPGGQLHWGQPHWGGGGASRPQRGHGSRAGACRPPACKGKKGAGAGAGGGGAAAHDLLALPLAAVRQQLLHAPLVQPQGERQSATRAAKGRRLAQARGRAPTVHAQRQAPGAAAPGSGPGRALQARPGAQRCAAHTCASAAAQAAGTAAARRPRPRRRSSCPPPRPPPPTPPSASGTRRPPRRRR
jgi:hypothetical protein